MTAMASYALYTTSVPANIQPTYGPWLMNRFKFITGGSQQVSGYVDLTPYRGTGNGWMAYVDTCSLYTSQLYHYLYPAAAANPFITDPEGMLLHMTVDNSVSAAYIGADQFDIYEQLPWYSSGGGSTAYSANGVLTLVGSTYADKTKVAYISGPVSVTDRLLIGDGIPFDTVKFTVGTARVGGSVTYQYWNGTTFAALTPASDTTSGLRSTGVLTFSSTVSLDSSRDQRFAVEILDSGYSYGRNNQAHPHSHLRRQPYDGQFGAWLETLGLHQRSREHRRPGARILRETGSGIDRQVPPTGARHGLQLDWEPILP